MNIFGFIDVNIPVPVEIKKNIKAISQVEKYANHAQELFLQYGPRLIIGLIFLLAGWWVIRIMVKGLNRLMIARDIDPTLRPFLNSLTSITLKVLLLLSVASQIGIQTTSFMAALGAAGLAIGLALQGSLANFAGGILILIFKPFKVGDYIGAQKYDGTVIEIQILYTILNTSDNKKIVIPNGILSNHEVVNYSANDHRRIDLKINIGYSANLTTAKEVIKKAVEDNELIMKDPKPIIGVGELTENAIVFNVWFWVKREDYLTIKHQVQEHIKLGFDQADIRLPWSELELFSGKKEL